MNKDYTVAHKAVELFWELKKQLEYGSLYLHLKDDLPVYHYLWEGYEEHVDFHTLYNLYDVGEYASWMAERYKATIREKSNVN